MWMIQIVEGALPQDFKYATEAMQQFLEHIIRLERAKVQFKVFRITEITNTIKNPS